MRTYRTLKAFSAGGIIYRCNHDEISDQLPQEKKHDVEVVLIGRAASGMWALPKGTPLAGETVEQVAIREVSEETGLQVSIVSDLGSIFYTFVRNNIRFDKEVHHYLMKPTGGDLSLHDHEYDLAEWFSIDEAFKRLTYQSEREVLQRAQESILALCVKK